MTANAEYATVHIRYSDNIHLNFIIEMFKINVLD